MTRTLTDASANLKEVNSHPLLRAVNLRRQFSIGVSTVEVLKGVDLEVVRSEILFLRGASGAGKTTLLYILAGLERPDSGDVFLDFPGQVGG